MGEGGRTGIYSSGAAALTLLGRHVSTPTSYFARGLEDAQIGAKFPPPTAVRTLCTIQKKIQNF
jgi:hypothetical protein